MATKRRTASRRRAAPRRRSGGRKGITLGPVVGAVLGGLNLYRSYTNIAAGTTDKGAALVAALGVDMDASGNYLGINKGRVLGYMAPPIAGMAIHEVVGKTTGALGSGVGLKLNRYLPKGINL